MCKLYAKRVVYPRCHPERSVAKPNGSFYAGASVSTQNSLLNMVYICAMRKDSSASLCTVIIEKIPRLRSE